MLVNKKAGILFFCFALTQCSETIDLMDRPIHETDSTFQNEDYRLLPMDGAHNARELGGYKTTDGKSVKWGMLYRSDKLSDISDTDQAYLQDLGIKKIIDFLGSSLNSSVLVGDTSTDYMTSQAAGVPFILVLYGHGVVHQNFNTSCTPYLAKSALGMADLILKIIKKY